MRAYPIPFNDPARLAALRHLPGLDAGSEPVFDGLCDAARHLFGCPVAHVSVVEEDHQWFKSLVGIEYPSIPRDLSFCTHAIMSDDFMVVPDLPADPRFAGHPLVAGEPHVRFYAGAPVVLSDGYRVGSICALDFAPHPPATEAQLGTLRALADAAAGAMERKPAAEVAADRRAQEAARLAFTTLISHELRTPLTMIFGYSRLLEQRLTGADAKMAQGVLRSSEHLRDLIETILAYSNLATGDLALKEGPVDLARLAADLLEIEGPGIDAQGKSLELRGLDLPGPLLLDESQFKLALTALVENARLHGGRRVTLSARVLPEGPIEVTIGDDGQIDPELRIETLYEPFVVGEALDTRRNGGLGLGLPLTRKIIELHGGELELAPETGGTFATLRLPGWRLQTAAA